MASARPKILFTIKLGIALDFNPNNIQHKQQQLLRLLQNSGLSPHKTLELKMGKIKYIPSPGEPVEPQQYVQGIVWSFENTEHEVTEKLSSIEDDIIFEWTKFTGKNFPEWMR